MGCSRLPAFRIFAFLFSATALASACGGGSTNVGAPCETVAVLYSEDSYLSQVAKECSTGLCVKPVDRSASRTADTTALCTAGCQDDNDCDGELRDQANTKDKRCETGFSCMIPFSAGYKACKKLCICKDFLPAGSPTVPAECAN